MSRFDDVQRPAVVKAADSMGGEQIDHPAFAHIGANRVSASPGVTLYGSDFLHQHFVTVTISKASLRRSLSHDWSHGGSEEYIEVDLSESQWAAFVSSMNVGTGVQCTLRHLQRTRVPGLPPPESRLAQARKEVQETADDALAHLDKLLKSLDDMALPKRKAEELREHLRMARQELVDNLPFVAKSFDEHMDQTVQRAKTEVNAYVTSIIQRTGLAAIANGTAPIVQVEDKTEGKP